MGSCSLFTLSVTFHAASLSTPRDKWAIGREQRETIHERMRIPITSAHAQKGTDRPIEGGRPESSSAGCGYLVGFWRRCADSSTALVSWKLALHRPRYRRESKAASDLQRGLAAMSLLSLVMPALWVYFIGFRVVLEQLFRRLRPRSVSKTG